MTTTQPSTVPRAPTASSPAEAPPAADDPRAVFAKAVALGGAVIEAVRPDQLEGPTPCAELDVRNLVAHLVGVVNRVAAIGRGDDPMSVPTVVDGIADDRWSQAWADAAHEVQAVWADASVLTRLVRLPWAELPGAAAMAMYTNEVTVHTWDLAVATGQRPTWDDEVLTVAFDAIRRGLPAEGRMELLQAAVRAMPADLGPVSLPFGEAVTVPADAPLIDRLVAWNGRRPSTD